MGGEKEEGEKSWLRHPNSRPLFCSIAIQLWGLPLSLQGQLLVPWSPSESVSCLSPELPWCGGLLLSTPGSTKGSPMTATNAQNSGLQSSHLTPDVTLFWWQQRWGTSASPVTLAGTDRNDAAQGESLELLPTGLPPESPRHVSSGLRPSGIDSWALSLLQGPLPHHRSPANLSEIHSFLRKTSTSPAGKDALPYVCPSVQVQGLTSAIHFRAAWDFILLPFPSHSPLRSNATHVS